MDGGGFEVTIPNDRREREHGGSDSQNQGQSGLEEIVIERVHDPESGPDASGLGQPSTGYTAQHNTEQASTEHADTERSVNYSPPSQASAHYKLTEDQQERFINYLDESLRKINRNFIRKFDTTGQGYQSFAELSEDLSKVIEIISYSIFSGTDTSKPFLYRQMFFLLTIADSLVDYITSYAQYPGPEMFEVTAKLDDIFARLLDGETPGHITMRPTEAVRLESIAERTRTEITHIFDKIEGYEIEESKVYDKVLERNN